jgi:hypothetical protein
MVSKSVEICRIFCIWLTSPVSVLTVFSRVAFGVWLSLAGVKAVCELRLICLCFHSTIAPSTFALRSCFWILMGRSLLLWDRELVSNDYFMGRVDVFSGFWKLRGVFLIMGLGYTSIRWYSFWFFGDPLIYDTFVCCSSYIGLCSSCTEIWLLIILYFPFKKNT